MKLTKNIETVFFHPRITNDEIQNHIINKFNNETIDTEKLHGQLQGVLSFRLTQQQRVICVIHPYQGKSSLVILELLLDHKYENYHKDNFLNIPDWDKKISEENWISFNNNTQKADVEKALTTSVFSKWSIQLDTISALDSQQLTILEQTNERPIVTISGVAGSGKTLVAEVLMEQARNRKAESKILYVTQSENLVNSVKEYCQQAGIIADIKSYQEVCCSIIINKLFKNDDFKYYRDSTKDKTDTESLLTNALAIINGNKYLASKNPELFKYIYSHLHGEINFIHWYKGDINVRQLYQDICKKHNSENFDNLGAKNLYYEKQTIEENYKSYKKQLTENRLIDLALIDYPEENDAQYDYILIDESQDFVRRQLQFIHSWLKENGRIYFFTDTNQSIENDFNLVDHDIKSLTATPETDISKYELKRGYRNSQKVIELANRVLCCGRLLVGGVINSGLRAIEAVEDAAPGYIEWIDTNNETSTTRCFNLLQQNPSKLQMVIVIPSHSKANEELAKKLFPQRMLFTPKEIKGLEFDKIVLVNFFTKDHFQLKNQLKQLENIHWGKEDKYNKPKNTDNAHYNRPSAEVFVGVTRARKSVYILQSTTDKVAILFKETIFKDIINLNQEEDTLLRDSSLEETLRYLENNAAKLESPNLLLLCEEILNKSDESTDITCIKSLEKIKTSWSNRNLAHRLPLN